jgi:ABC-2 type transport system ATP-binding protein
MPHSAIPTAYQPPPGVPALAVELVSKTFVDRPIMPWGLPFRPARPAKRTTAVDAVSFTVPRGEIWGILGANGSGKSTLIRLVSTLLIPDTGRVQVFGHDVVSEDLVVKRLINRVSVEAAFFRVLSPMENLLYAARLYGLGAAEARRRIVEILTQLDIEAPRIEEPLHKMSRGMQQKVAIARAFLTSPVLLLLDEPTTGLDPRSKRDVQRSILQVRDEHDATVLLTTHDMDEAERLCDRIAVMHRGRIVAQDTPERLKQGLAGAVTLEEVFMALTGQAIDDEAEPAAAGG